MANSNFVVHNGLSVGPTSIDAASGNITIPVGRHITIGNVMLRDNGGGRLAIRDITDNNDAIIDATLDSGTQTLGNIQIGTNHIESINANGPVSIRPNGSGNIALAANTVMLGKGGAYTLISTGEQTDATLGLNFTPSNIIVQTTGALSSGNIRVPMTTAATSLTTGAFQVTGGASVGGALFVGNIILPGSSSNIQIGPQYTSHTNAPLDVSIAANSYVQINIQNVASVGTLASADFVATAVDGTDSTKFIDMGINGNNFSSSAWTISGANDGYVYIDGGHLTVGTATAAKDLIFHTGGLTADKIRARYYDTAGNLTVFQPLTVTGLATLAGINSSANILATGGVLNSLTVNGNITVTTAYVMPSANAASSLGTSAARWNYIYGVNGNFLSVNANYADLAEKYVADADYAPGTVVEFGGDKEVTQCDTDMSSRVAGVVSTNPAYLMNSGLEGEYTVELALTGRVPTKVRGPIRKGDLIVSAGDGHARAETLPQVGTVIGKALEDFDGDAGVIEVVVGKH